MSHGNLRKAVQAAWDAVLDDFLKQLLDGMKARMEAVNTANGKHTKY